MVLRVQLAEVWCYDESAGQLLEYGSVAKMVIVPACLEEQLIKTPQQEDI